jgi:hypothetical protein
MPNTDDMFCPKLGKKGYDLIHKPSGRYRFSVRFLNSYQLLRPSLDR